MRYIILTVFTRCKTLGENYTEEAITRRIKGLAVDRGPNRQRKGITLRIDLENNIKAQQSAGYARWAKLENLKQAAKTVNFLTEHGIEQYAELESKVAEISAANDEAAAALKDVERRLGNMAVLIKNLTTYKQLRPVVLEYRKAKDKAAFRREHESQLILYEAAAKAIKDAGITRLPDLAALKAEYRELDKQKARLYEQYGEVKRELKEYGIIKSDTATVNKIKAAIQAAYEEGQSKLKGNGKSVPALSAIKTPLRDGDLERPDDEAYKNSYFINANSSTAPGIVDADRQPILERSEVYSGVYGRASINLYAFNSNGNKGIACGLNNLQKIRDGEPLGGKSRAEDDFAVADDEDDFLD